MRYDISVLHEYFFISTGNMLVALGFVMKRLVMLWRGEKTRKLANKKHKKQEKSKEAEDRMHRLSKENNALEFQQRGKLTWDLKKWKAIDFENVLLDGGPVIPKGEYSF